MKKRMKFQNDSLHWDAQRKIMEKAKDLASQIQMNTPVVTYKDFVQGLFFNHLSTALKNNHYDVEIEYLKKLITQWKKDAIIFKRLHRGG